MRLVLAFLFSCFLFSGFSLADNALKSNDVAWDELLKDTFQKAEEGDVNSQAILGGLQLYGAPGVKKDTVSALKLLNLSAEQGNANAMFSLFQAFQGGIGVVKDDEIATSWLQKSAEGGNRNSQFLLGLKYADGENVDQDKEKAVMWYTKAAKQGQADAQYMMGVNYYSGYGSLSVNDVESYAWLLVASQNPKTKDKQDVLSFLAKSRVNLSLDELSEAEQKGQEYLFLYLEPFL